MDWIFGAALSWLTNAVGDRVNRLWALLTQTLFFTPDVTALPQVQALASRSLLVVNTAFVLVIMGAGVLGMTHGTIQVRYRMGDLVPRMVIAFGLANLAPTLCRWIITAANTLVGALTGDPIASPGSLGVLLRVVTGALTNPVSHLLVAILALVIEVLLAMLLLTWIARLITLIVLCGIAPVALACHAMPFTDPVAQLWWRSMGGIVAVVVLQAVALHTSLAIFLDPGANPPPTGLPADPSGVLNLFIVVCLLWVTVRIPGLVRRYVRGSGGRPNVFGAIVRIVLVHQLTRGAGTLLRGATRTAGAGRAARGLGPGGGGPGGAGRPGGGPSGGGSSSGSGGSGPTRTSAPRPTGHAGRSPRRPVPSRPSPSGAGSVGQPRTHPTWQSTQPATASSGTTSAAALPPRVSASGPPAPAAVANQSRTNGPGPLPGVRPRPATGSAPTRAPRPWLGR